MYHADAASGECRVFTWRAGALSAFGHDLELAVGRFTIDADEERRTVVASFDAGSLRVVGATRDGIATALAPADRERIERTIAAEVLEAARYPEIRFASSDVVDADDGFRAAGRLALHGRERSLVVAVRREGGRYVAAATVHQPDFGIAPYAALFGTLRVKADVLVRIVMPPRS